MLEVDHGLSFLLADGTHPGSAPGTDPALGILGPGWIAERFVPSLKENTKQEIVAVGARDPAKAQAFAERWGIARAYAGIEALVGDPGIDAVYVATPHHHHFPCATMAIEAGKYVLVEKPLALNAAEAKKLADAALDKGVFSMEAYWTTSCPSSTCCVSSSRTAPWARSTRFSPITASTSGRTTELCAPTWPAARCLISAPIR